MWSRDSPYRLASAHVACLISRVRSIHSRKTVASLSTKYCINTFTCIFLISLHNNFSNHQDYGIPFTWNSFLALPGKILILHAKEFPPLRSSPYLPRKRESLPQVCSEHNSHTAPITMHSLIPLSCLSPPPACASAKLVTRSWIILWSGLGQSMVCTRGSLDHCCVELN